MTTEPQGRDDHLERIEVALEAGRDGSSSRIVLVGEPGVGKTALLHAAERRADGYLILRATGSEAEAELSFAALHALVRPILSHLDDMPERLSAALRSALAIGPPTAPDPFALRVATFEILIAATERSPVLCLLDDVHWFDPMSLDAVSFAARRMHADRAVMLAALRPAAGRAGLAGFETCRVDELSRSSASILVTTMGCARSVARAVVAAVGGNPLVLREVVSALTDEERSGEAPLPDDLVAGADLLAAFGSSYRALPDRSRRAVTVLAASTTDDRGAVLAGLTRVGLHATDLEPAEASGLVALGGDRVRFVHPVVRTAVWSACRPGDRRTAHAALAAEAAEADDIERQARHLVAATIEPSDAVKAVVLDAAATAAGRGDQAQASSLFASAARCAVDVEERAGLLLAAAAAAAQSGLPVAPLTLRSRALSSDAGLRADALTLSLMARLWQVDQPGPVPADRVEADRLVGADPVRAAGLLGMLALWSWREGRADDMFDDALRGWNAIRTDLADAPGLALLAPITFAFSRSHRVGYPDGLAVIERVVEALDGGIADDLIPPAATALLAWGRVDEMMGFLERSLERARSTGSVANASWILVERGFGHLRRGDLVRARADVEAGHDLATAVDLDWAAALARSLMSWLDAVQGQPIDPPRSIDHLDELLVLHASGMAELSTGRAHDAVARFAPVWADLDRRTLAGNALVPLAPDLIEALARVGRRDQAVKVLAEWDECLHPSGAAFFALARARSELLVIHEDDLHGAIERARAAMALRIDPFGTARTQLVIGERLRRARRILDARTLLHEAVAGFAALNARPWEARARAELEATGQRSAPDGGAADGGTRLALLTPQELQIAELVAGGMTNPEVASAVFLSRKTVEMHLTKVYRKLGVRSRVDLARTFAG